MARTAASLSLAACHVCGRLSRVESAGHRQYACRRCGSALHLRKPQSLERTWALVIAAFVLYIPANVYPIMSIKMFGRGDPHTILGGVIALFEEESYPSAILVLFASVMVPLLKLVGLTYLMLSIHFKSRWRPADRTRLYRIIELVGRWSMIDIFMLSILVALVNLGAIALVEPGAGATFFAAVVITTMFAAASFDPRLIWDAMEKTDDR